MSAILAFMLAGMAIAMVVLGGKLSKASTARDKAIADRVLSEATAVAVSVESKTFRAASKKRMAALREKIERLEDDLENCSTPGAKRNRLRDLVSFAQEAEATNAD